MTTVDSLRDSLIEESKNKYSGYSVTNTAIYYRDFDSTFEVLGLVSDPTINPEEFQGREILFPKKWVTLNTYTLEELNER